MAVWETTATRNRPVQFFCQQSVLRPIIFRPTGDQLLQFLKISPPAFTPDPRTNPFGQRVMRPFDSFLLSCAAASKTIPAQGLVEYALALPILLCWCSASSSSAHSQAAGAGKWRALWCALCHHGLIRPPVTAMKPGSPRLYSEDLNPPTPNVDCEITPRNRHRRTKERRRRKWNALQDRARLASIRDRLLAGATGIAGTKTVSGVLSATSITPTRPPPSRPPARQPQRRRDILASICSNASSPQRRRSLGRPSCSTPIRFNLEPPLPCLSKEEYRYPISAAGSAIPADRSPATWCPM
jgi:hypothetical protein